MSSIRQPQPRPSSPQESRRLLDSHHSVFEALQNHHDLETDSPCAHGLSLNTPTLLNLDFSATSWQSIPESVLAPRPTSSVLSSSDTEEEDSNDSVPGLSQGRTVTNSSAITTQAGTLRDTREDEEKTIEIDLNDAVKTRHFFGPELDHSSFVMPDFTSLDSQEFLGSKILIIGHKKHSFYKQLDTALRSKFTLNLNDPYKFIIVIFDGLIKIGNILNFIKNHVDQLSEKLFIPIFRNLNSKIVDKILRVHNVELLCPPVSLDNEVQVQNLLDFLREDFLLQSMPMIQISNVDFEQVALPPVEFSPDDFQLIRLNRADSGSSSSSENHSTTLDGKSVLITHQVERLRYSKKLKHRRKAGHPRWSLLGISLSLGIGIGVTVALFIPYLKSTKKITIPKEASPIKVASNAVKSMFKHAIKETKDYANLTGIKRHAGEISRLVYQGTRTYVCGLKNVLDQLVNDASTVNSKSYTHPLFWYL